LLKHFEEFGKYVAIAGFRNVKVKDSEELIRKIRKEKPSDVEIQFFNAEFVATWEHLYFAVLNALTAFKNKKSISKSVAMETMLYASAQRQIQKAMKLLGIKSDSSEIVVVTIGGNLEGVKSALTIVSKYINAKRDDTVLQLSEKKVKLIKKTFGISDIELKTLMERNNLKNALVNLVIERMALLATQH